MTLLLASLTMTELDANSCGFGDSLYNGARFVLARLADDIFRLPDELKLAVNTGGAACILGPLCSAGSTPLNYHFFSGWIDEEQSYLQGLGSKK